MRAKDKSWRRSRAPALRTRRRRSPLFNTHSTHSRAKRIVLITPYRVETTEHEAQFLRACGYDVLHAKGFALAGSDAYCATPPQFWRDRAIEAARADADAYLVSCANISVFGVIEELEAELARPVVTSNQAVIWDALRLVGWRDGRGCPGRVFGMTAPADRLTSRSACP